ncbi:MAG: serine dehydratase, partial [Lactobacillus iners]|nr:serine dehydratase [Lactobacillus iners]
YNKQQSFNGTGFVLYEFDIINYISPQIVNSLHKKYPGIICL